MQYKKGHEKLKKRKATMVNMPPHINKPLPSPAPVQANKTAFKRVLDFIEQPILLTIFGILGSIVGAFYLPVSRINTATYSSESIGDLHGRRNSGTNGFASTLLPVR